MIKLRSLAAILGGAFLCLALGTTTLYAQVTFSDFSDVSSLSLKGSATQANSGGKQVLRLNADGSQHVSGTAWFKTEQQSVSAGFTSVFQFQITHAGAPADGLAFVIQNSSGTGQGIDARGGSGGAIGYGVPDPGDNGVAIPNSVAIEFDTFHNSWDPNANHIAVQSCGTAPNSQDHTGPCNRGLVSDLGGINLSDGNVHTIVIDYDPGTLRVFLDNLGVAVLTITDFDLSSVIQLNDGNAWVGFTGSAGAQTETDDILSWNFTPATDQTSITQELTPGTGEPTDTNYVFGSYNKKLEYTGAKAGDSVTVTAIPIDQQLFHDTRLADTPFSDASCAIFEGTGGKCVLFRVQCTQESGSDCTDLDYNVFNNFNTDETINGACMLKTPIDTNNWINIIQTFTQTRTDPGAKGGSKGFSDFIIAQNCTAPPGITINTPANGGFYFVGQTITVSFACAPDPLAPLVTVTSCTGNLNGNPVNPNDTYTFTAADPVSGSLIVSATDTVLNSISKTSSFTMGQAPVFTSANNATFQTGAFGSFTVTTTGTPAAAITETGTLPGGVTLVDQGNGTAKLSGTPTTGGVYNIVLSAINGGGSAVQSFTLTVNQAPVITSANNATFQLGAAGLFTITTTGFPTPTISETGALPGGVTFTNNGDGTAKLSGTPTGSGTFGITLTASSVAGSTNQSFTLTVAGAQVSITPSSINFGTVQFLKLVAQNVTVKNVGTSTLKISKVAITDIQADWDDFTPVNFCPGSLAPGKSCVISVIFFADDLGLRTATLNITDNASGSPQQVPLSATVVKKGH